MRSGWKILLGLGVLVVAVMFGLTMWRLPLATRVAPSFARLVVDSHGQITLNGSPITEARLGEEMKRLHLDRPESEFHFQPRPDAPYASVDHVLQVIRKNGVTKLGFIGNERYTEDPPGNDVAP